MKLPLAVTMIALSTISALSQSKHAGAASQPVLAGMPLATITESINPISSPESNRTFEAPLGNLKNKIWVNLNVNRREVNGAPDAENEFCVPRPISIPYDIDTLAFAPEIQETNLITITLNGNDLADTFHEGYGIPGEPLSPIVVASKSDPSKSRAVPGNVRYMFNGNGGNDIAIAYPNSIINGGAGDDVIDIVGGVKPYLGPIVNPGDGANVVIDHGTADGARINVTSTNDVFSMESTYGNPEATFPTKVDYVTSNVGGITLRIPQLVPEGAQRADVEIYTTGYPAGRPVNHYSFHAKIIHNSYGLNGLFKHIVFIQNLKELKIGNRSANRSDPKPFELSAKHIQAFGSAVYTKIPSN